MPDSLPTGITYNARGGVQLDSELLRRCRGYVRAYFGFETTEHDSENVAQTNITGQVTMEMHNRLVQLESCSDAMISAIGFRAVAPHHVRTSNG